MRLSAAQCIALTGGLVLRSSEASEGDSVRQCSSSEHRWGEAEEKFLNKVLKFKNQCASELTVTSSQRESD